MKYNFSVGKPLRKICKDLDSVCVEWNVQSEASRNATIHVRCQQPQLKHMAWILLLKSLRKKPLQVI